MAYARQRYLFAPERQRSHIANGGPETKLSLPETNAQKRYLLHPNDNAIM